MRFVMRFQATYAAVPDMSSLSRPCSALLQSCVVNAWHRSVILTQAKTTNPGPLDDPQFSMQSASQPGRKMKVLQLELVGRTTRHPMTDRQVEEQQHC